MFYFPTAWYDPAESDEEINILAAAYLSCHRPSTASWFSPIIPLSLFIMFVYFSVT